jgi:hypothetical protein
VTRMSDQHLLRQLQYRDRLMALNTRKVVKKDVQGIPIFEIVEQGLNRYPGAHEYGDPA